MRPEEVLPDETDAVDAGGVVVRKGSVGASLCSAAVLTDADSHAQAGRDLRALVPALAAIGLFDIFAVRDPNLRSLVEEALAQRPRQ